MGRRWLCLGTLPSVLRVVHYRVAGLDGFRLTAWDLWLRALSGFGM